MKSITTSALALVLTLAATTGHATTRFAGADEGHDNDLEAGVNACQFNPLSFTPAITCMAPIQASGSFDWQIPLPVSGTTSTLVTLTATGVAQVPISGANDPNEALSARLLNWNQTGGLLCATSGAAWGKSSAPVNHALGSCSVNPTTDRPEAEFFVGHVRGQAVSLEPRVYGVSYSY